MRSLSSRRRAAIALGSAAVYIVLFDPLYHLFGSGIAALAAVPLAIAGWLFGWRLGIVAGLLALPVHMLLLRAAGEPGWGAAFRNGGGLVALGLLLLSAIAGWLGNTLDHVRQQSAELDRERILIHAASQASTLAQAALQESEQRFRTLIHDLQVGVLIHGPAAEILLSNQAARELLGLTEAQLHGRNSFDHDWRVIHQDGRPFLNEVHPVPQAIATRKPVRDVIMGVFRAPTNDWLWLLVDARPQLAANGSVQQVICTLSDITARQRTEQALRRHDAMLEAVSFAAARFLETPNWELVIQAVLERLGAATVVSRVYIFSNHPGGAGELLTSQQYEWSAAGATPLLANQELQDFSFQARGFARWETLLSQGEAIYGHVRAFPAAEQRVLFSHSIDSIVLVPIFVAQEWWGYIGFDQCDGERDWSLSDVDVLKAAAGILGSAIERERVDLTLRGSEQRYRKLFAAARRQAQDLALLNHVRAGLARELDLHSIFRMVVEAIANAFGYTQVSLYLLQDNVLHLEHQVGYDRVITRIPLSEGISGRVVRTAKPALLKDARTDPAFLGAIAGIISEICVPLFDQGQVVGVLNIESSNDAVLQEADLNIMVAITEHINIAIERAQLYNRVRENERQYRSVLESLKEVVFQTGTTGVWIFLNPAWTEITGFLVSETIGHWCFDYAVPEDRATYQNLFQSLIDRERSDCQNEIRFRTADGSTRWVELRARPTFDDHGILIGISGTLADITSRKRAEEERRLIERKMLESQKLESLGVLAGGIAHDFNNLLMAILGNTDLALFDLSPADPAYVSLLQIQITAKRAAELTGQMLAYAGKGKFLLQRFDLNLLVEEITLLLRVSIAKTTTLRYNLSASLPLIEGDTAQLRQVVMNLVINAAEALGAQEGSLTISTSVRHVDRAYLATTQLALDLPVGAYVCLEVADTGSGMTESTLANIFDPFFTTKFTGRGLGLAAVLGIVRGHQGALKVRSALGKGTSFTILLPIAAELSVGTGQIIAPVPAVTALAIAPQQQTILVVDDESGVRSATAALLERAGFQVLTASDGRSAVELFRAQRQRINGVLLDLMMPYMNGEEALRAMRALQPGLGVVIMSGYNEYELTSRFADLEAVNFLQKPFAAQALYQKIDQMLADRTPAHSRPMIA